MPVEVIAVSAGMRRALELAERVAAAPSSSTLLVFGESGTGKNLLAHYVHERSGVAGDLVTIDCGALPESLLESELFGHERGAFTGATDARAGRLEAARGGTLVLDRIGSLTLHAQAKLLRVLDERRFHRLGGSRAIPLDARVIALSDVDLRRAAEAGEFRQDLFYRLNVVTIGLPPLREQPEAIGPLAEVFAARFAARPPGEEESPAVPAGRLTGAALRLLESYRFPGNVRELRNLIERSSVHGATRITPDNLPEQVRASCASQGRDATRPTLAEVEADYIRTVLAESLGNKALAAKVLGISRKSLYERLRRMEPSEVAEPRTSSSEV